MRPGTVVSIAAAVVAALVWVSDGPAIVTLDWAIYDGWLRTRAQAHANVDLVIVARDPLSEARLGAESWDSAVLARVVTALARAGAIAVGMDASLGQPGARVRGGAAGDALLSQATDLAGNVVFPIVLAPGVSDGSDTAALTSAPNPSWPSASSLLVALPSARTVGTGLLGLVPRARAVGHTLALPDADDVIRRVPAFVRVGDRGVPAFGLALAAAHLNLTPGQALARIPIDRAGRALVGFDGPGLPGGAREVSFHELWSAIDAGGGETLGRLVHNKLVLVLVDPARGQRKTPLGVMSDVTIQAHLLAAIERGEVPREVGRVWTLLATVVLAALAAWAWLAWPWWIGLAGTAGLGLGTVAVLLLALSWAGLAVPLSPLLAALTLASVGALLWSHFASRIRLRHLESENARAREALVRQESAVEALEEDLEAARAAVGATDALRAQVTQARGREEESRRRLADLERELRDLQPAREHLVVLDEPAQERARRECARSGIITRDAGMLAAFRDLEKAAGTSLPILILGEPGTGKELFARAAHRLGPRAAQPFVPVNMAAIPPELFESELFGHVRGSFTGAVSDRKGYFEQADRGTIFLDEVGEMRPDHQSKLLRVLQDRTFHRVGATRSTTVDVRVVAASNRDLEAGVAQGWFREDLYFRLKGLVIQLPPLRARPGDLPLLAARLVEEAAAEERRDGLVLSEDALAALQDHDWPGNVRELQHCLRQAVALAEGPVIRRENLRLPRTPRGSHPDLGDPDAGSDAAVLTSLRRHGFDMQATARALGWDRSTVTQRLKGLAFRALVESGGDRAQAATALAGDPALARTVELKLRDYHEHLVRTVQVYDSAEAAVAGCRRRFKNLPERHFQALEVLVRQHFDARRLPG